MDSRVAVVLQPADWGSTAAALECIQKGIEVAGPVVPPLVYSVELALLGSLVEPEGRLVLERGVAVVRPFSLTSFLNLRDRLSVRSSHAHNVTHEQFGVA